MYTSYSYAYIFPSWRAICQTFIDSLLCTHIAWQCQTERCAVVKGKPFNDLRQKVT